MEMDMKQIRKSLRESPFRLPYVMRNEKLGMVYIIYSNKVEFYKLHSKTTKNELDKSFVDDGGWNSEKEKEMALGSGFERVFIPKEENLGRYK